MSLSQEDKKKIEKLWDEGIRNKSEITRKVGRDRGAVSKYVDFFLAERMQEELKILDGKMSNGNDKVKQDVSRKGEKEIDKDPISQKDEVHFDSAESKIRALPDAIDELIEAEHLKGADRAEWEKRKEEIREILRAEVDARIPNEKDAAVEEKDKIWYKEIEECYILKEDSEKEIRDHYVSIEDFEKETEEHYVFKEDSENEIEGRDNKIKELEKNIVEKDDVISNQGTRLKNSVALEAVEKSYAFSFRCLSCWSLHQIKPIEYDTFRSFLEGHGLICRQCGNNNFYLSSYNNLRRENNDIIRKNTRLNDVIKYNTVGWQQEEKRIKAYEATIDKYKEKTINEHKTKSEELRGEREEFKKKKKEDENMIKENQERVRDELKNLEDTAMEQKIKDQRIQMHQEIIDKTRGLNILQWPCHICGESVLFDAASNPVIKKALEKASKDEPHPECVKKQQQLLKEKNRGPSLIPLKKSKHTKSEVS